jgi:sec-independent protein translocase protein TatC
MPEVLSNKKTPPEKDPAGEPKKRNFWQHLEKLRWHIIRVVLAIFGLAMLAFLNRHIVFDEIILAPLNSDFPTNLFLCKIGKWLSIPALCIDTSSLKIINVSMSGQFLTHLSISFVAGIIMAFPYIIFEIWSYISFLFNIKNKLAGTFAIIIGTALFMIGVLFSFYLIVPLTVNFLGTYFVSSDVQNTVTLSSYISTITSLVLAVGVVFELPLLVFFLSKFGVIGPGFLRKKRKYMIVVIFVVAAIITPPDVVSQMMVSIPLLLLYEVSIWVAATVSWRKKETENMPA